MSTITVDFTSQYAGPHRVCWRIGSSGAYDCSTSVNCGGSGASCQAVIDVGTLNNETCDDITFEGYIQAMCQDLSSLTDRIPFSVTFIPAPACKRYLVTCENVSVFSIEVTDGGSGYDPLNPPAVSITGGGGSGATGTAVVNGSGVITSITLDTAGSGYTSTPSVAIDPPSVGTQATAIAVLAPCPVFTGNDCQASSPAPSIGPLPLRESIAMCKQGVAPVLSDQYLVTQVGNCLCNCTQYTVSVAGISPGNVEVQYTNCNGDFVTTILTPGDLVSDCFVTSSLLIIPDAGAIFTSTAGAACPGA